MRTNRTAAALALVLTLAMTVSAGAVASSSPAAGVLELEAIVRMTYQFGDQYCPAEAPRFSRCVRFTGEGQVPGLGTAMIAYTKYLPSDEPSCPVVQDNAVVLTVAGKGRIELTRPGRHCGPTAPATTVSTYDVAAATGIYAGASGQLRVVSSVARIDVSCDCGRAQDTWTGRLTVPRVDFDTTPPTVTSTASEKTVRVPRRATGTRVRYSLTAQDAIDGSVPVSCSPPSGGRFRLGQTRVECSATDSNGNTRRVQFTVVVKRR